PLGCSVHPHAAHRCPSGLSHPLCAADRSLPRALPCLWTGRDAVRRAAPSEFAPLTAARYVMSTAAAHPRWLRLRPLSWLGTSSSLWVAPDRERCASRWWPTQKQGWSAWLWDAGVQRTDSAQPVIAAPPLHWRARRTAFSPAAQHTIPIPTV